MANQNSLLGAVQRASVRETEGTTAGLITLFSLLIGKERMKRRRNLRLKMAWSNGLRKNEILASTLHALVAKGLTLRPTTKRRDTAA